MGRYNRKLISRMPEIVSLLLGEPQSRSADDTEWRYGSQASRLPSFSDGPESIGEDRLVGEHRGEAFDQWDQLLFGHVRHEVVEHGALAEQRMGAALGGV